VSDEIGSVHLSDACRGLLFLSKSHLMLAALGSSGVVGYSIEQEGEHVHFMAPPVCSPFWNNGHMMWTAAADSG
jgi:hypothetical protein